MVNVANGPGVTYPDSLLAKKINAFKKLNPRKANRVNKIFLVVFILLICFNCYFECKIRTYKNAIQLKFSHIYQVVALVYQLSL